MFKIKVGTIFGKNIYIGNPKKVKNGEYWVKTEQRKPAGLFLKKNGELLPIFDKNSLQLQNVSILSTNHGDEVTVNPSEGYDAIGKVVYKKPKLEDKGTIEITENGTTEIKIGNNFDGLDDLVIVVSVE